MPRRRTGRAEPRSRSPRIATSGTLPFGHIELCATVLDFGCFGLRRAVLAERRRWRVLRLLHGDEPKDRVGQRDVSLDLAETLNTGSVFEEHVDRPSLLRDGIREIAHPPLEHLADGSTLVLDEGPDSCGELFGSRLALLRMDEDERLIAATRHA